MIYYESTDSQRYGRHTGLDRVLEKRRKDRSFIHLGDIEENILIRLWRYKLI